MKSFVVLSALLDVRAFDGPTPEARERSGQRWAEGLSIAYREKRGGVWFVSPEARLPDGTTVRARLAIGREPDRLEDYKLPPGHSEWSEKDLQRFFSTHELLSRWRAFTAARPNIPEEKIIGAFADEQRAWAAERGLTCTLTALRRYRRRLDPSSPDFDGNIDTRGRKKLTDEQKEQTMPPEVWGFFSSLYLQQNKLSIAEAYRVAKAKAAREGLHCPSLRLFQKRVAALPKPVVVLAREGPRRFEADCIPKLQRDYGSIPAGEHWIGDERILDLFCRVPDVRKGWRIIRPRLTAWLDLRSRMFVGWHIGERANSDTIIIALKNGARTFGFPVEGTIDNGKDYRSVGGKNRRKWADFDEQRLGTVFQQAGVSVHYAQPYHAWAKPIEPMFRPVKDTFDRHQPTFCGGSPEERPPDLSSRLKDLLAVPTLDEVRAAFGEWLVAYHATPQTGDGMLGLSPSLAMERFRGLVRKCSVEALDLICARLVGPVRVGRDGVRHAGVLYGRFDEAVYNLQGRDVWLRIHPDRVDHVVICDDKGSPICRAENRQMRAATREDIRAACQEKARLRRATKQYMAGREFMLDTTPGQIAALRREAAQAAEAELRKAMPEIAPPAVSIVRPDLHEEANRIGREAPIDTLARKFSSGAGGPAADLEPTESVGDLLARTFAKRPVEETTGQADLEVFDWADYRDTHGGQAAAG